MKTFKIKKGKHSSGFHFGFTFKDVIKFRATFDESCLYDIKDNDKYDVNKLFGFSTSWNHMKQSARIGWRCLNGSDIEVLSYSHNNGKIDFEGIKVLGTVKPDQPFSCTINDNKVWFVYTFRIDGDSEMVFTKNDKKNSWFPFKYFLFPYFGGNRVAPHDMAITIELFK